VRAALHVDGKRQGRRHQLAAVRAGGKLLYLKDLLTGSDFLVDTGASRSVLPHFSSDPPSGLLLVSADDSPIAMWGVQERQVNLAATFSSLSLFWGR
jgi:hypothetical protein